MKPLYRSVYHPAYLLILVLIIMFTCWSGILLNGFIQTMQIGEKIQWGATLFAPCIVLSFSIYVVVFYYRVMCRVIITNDVLTIGKKSFPLEIIEDVYYKKQLYKFLFTSQKQTSIIIKLISGEEILIWKDHYWNGRKIKPTLKMLLAAKTIC